MIFDGFVWISWIPGARGRAPCGTGLNRIKPDYTGVVPLLELCNLGTSILMTEPGGLQSWRLAASMMWISVDFIDSWGIWCPWLDDGKRWHSDGRFSDVH